MGSTPLRATAAEEALRGQGARRRRRSPRRPSRPPRAREPPGDLNATPDYKRHLARVLTRRALEAAARGVSARQPRSGTRGPGRRALSRRPGPRHGRVPGGQRSSSRCCSRARPGVGKTEVAKALAGATGARLIRLQCHEGIDLHHALYDWDYPRQLLHLRAEGGAAEEALYSERFLLRRPLLEALAGDRAGGAADRRDRPRRRRVRGVPARAAVRLPGLDPRARHGHGRAAAARGDHLQPHARAARRAQAPLPLPLDRLPDAGARGGDRARAAARRAGRDRRARLRRGRRGCAARSSTSCPAWARRSPGRRRCWRSTTPTWTRRSASCSRCARTSSAVREGGVLAGCLSGVGARMTGRLTLLAAVDARRRACGWASASCCRAHRALRRRRPRRPRAPPTSRCAPRSARATRTWRAFDAAFAEWFAPAAAPPAEPPPELDEAARLVLPRAAVPGAAARARRRRRTPSVVPAAWSDVELLRDKDFAEYTRRRAPAARAA